MKCKSAKTIHAFSKYWAFSFSHLSVELNDQITIYVPIALLLLLRSFTVGPSLPSAYVCSNNSGQPAVFRTFSMRMAIGTSD